MKRRRAGLTLIEFTVVFAIIAIVTAATVMTFRSFFRLKGLEQANARLKTLMLSARTYAVAHRVAVAVEIYTSGGGALENSARVGFLGAAFDPIEGTGAVKVPERIRIVSVTGTPDPGPYYVRYTPTGGLAPQHVGEVVVNLQSLMGRRDVTTGGDTAALRIPASTGIPYAEENLQ